ncbi:hypothetical protein B0H14DRAFT_1464224 [Mycena olivaceomarginata]|nr:hypothetical protein B0H14DRAFT_1464224 [Mycena olivaceomarginata]
MRAASPVSTRCVMFWWCMTLSKKNRQLRHRMRVDLTDSTKHRNKEVYFLFRQMQPAVFSISGSGIAGACVFPDPTWIFPSAWLGEPGVPYTYRLSDQNSLTLNSQSTLRVQGSLNSDFRSSSSRQRPSSRPRKFRELWPGSPNNESIFDA